MDETFPSSILIGGWAGSNQEILGGKMCPASTKLLNRQGAR